MRWNILLEVTATHSGRLSGELAGHKLELEIVAIVREDVIVEIIVTSTNRK